MQTILTFATLSLLGAVACGAVQPEAAPESAERYEISWNWPKERTVYGFERTTVDRIPVPGKDPVVEQVLARVVAHRVAEHAEETGDGVTPVRMTWEAVLLERNDSLQRPIVYNSSIPAHASRTSTPAVAGVAATLGQSVIVEFEPNGTAMGVQGLKDLLRGIEYNLTEWNLANAQTFERLEETYTPETLAAETSGTYAFLPEEPISVGESYEISRPVSFEYVRTLESQETHTFKSVTERADGHRIATFTIEGTVAWPDPGGEAGERFNVSLDKPKLSGSWNYDLDTGLVLSYTLRCSFLADIVRYDPADGSSSEQSTQQSLTERMTLLRNVPPPTPVTPEPTAPADGMGLPTP